ncbi:MAG: glycosyltransferase family 1 protein [Candidatus Moraniibacteriota bacterium]
MKIGIDARFYGPNVKGLGRYLQKLIENLERLEKDSDNEYFVFLTQEGYKSFNPQNKNFHKVLADFRWYGWKEQFAFPFLIMKYKLDLMHFGHFNVPIFFRKKFVVTIHDLILFHYPTHKNTTLNKIYYLFKLLAYRLVIKSAVKRAVRVIAVSEFTKQDILKNFNIKKEKISIIKEGYEIKNKEEESKPKTLPKKYVTIKPYLLYVGNAYPHKNLERLCLAFKSLRKQRGDLKLVLVGGKDYFYNRLERFIKQNQIENIHLTGFVSDDVLEGFYREAECYIFPSLYEGFGLPPLEALSFGCPVVSSNRSSMPEILEDGAVYFNPESLDSIQGAIKDVLDNPKRKKEIIANGKKRLSLYDWEKAAKETLHIYKNVLQ